MKIELVYTVPLRSGFGHYAERFVSNYMQYPPCLDHKSTVVCNDCEADLDTKGLFSLLPNLNLVHYPGNGRDIGAYQFASQSSDADMIVFFNASVYLKRPGWLVRMATVFNSHGDGLYGTMGNQGDKNVNVQPHVRTTGFWCSPKLFNAYPHKVTAPEQRYPFEHGPNCLSTWVKNRGLRVLVVTWSECKPVFECDSLTNGFHQGTQSELLCGDRISDQPYYPTP